MFDKYILILFGILLVSSCKKENKLDLSESNPKIIDINSKNNNQIELNQLFEKIKFIILENTKEGFLSKATRVFEHHNQYYIFDDTLNKIVVFSSDGKFLRTIGSIGSGPGEFKDLNDLSFDYKNEYIQALAIDKNSIINYNLEGDFINSYKTDFPIYSFANLESMVTGFYIGYYSDDFYNFKITDIKNEVVFKGFKFPNDVDLNKFAFTGYLTTYNDTFLYSEATSSRIFQINKNGQAKIKYTFNFNKNPWSEENIYKHDLFFDKIQKGQLSFLRSQYQENVKALVFNYNHSVEDNPKLRTNYPKVGVYLKSSDRVYTHFNFENDFLYNFLTSPKGKTEDDKFFISTISDSEAFIKKLLTIKDKDNIIVKEFNKGKNLHRIDPESTILVLYRFK